MNSDGSAFGGVKAISTGSLYSMALKEDGTIWAWGNNSMGQIGDGTKQNKKAPVWLSSPPDATGIAAGRQHSLAAVDPTVTPTVSSISPATGARGHYVSISNLSGNGFYGVPAVKLKKSGEPDIAGVFVTLESRTRISCGFNIPAGARTGDWNVYVENPDGKSAVRSRAFTVASPESTWYLAEGSTGWGFDTYITIQNPNDSEVTARITYMDPSVTSGSGKRGTRKLTLPPLSQTTVDPRSDLGDIDFSTMVECLENKSIAVDRTMLWSGEGAASFEAHNSMGATEPFKTWYLPEGSSDHGFDTWITVQNPNSVEANIGLTYMTEGFGAKLIERKVPAYSRATYSMTGDIGARDSSIRVASSVPVIAERSTYRNSRRQGSCSMGTPAPGKDCYLAEGSTAWGFTTYILVQNPNNSEAEVILTYMTPGGAAPQEPFKLAANSRKTVKVNDALPGTDFSTRVHANKPVVAERAMYWDSSTGEACHASTGLSSPHGGFLLPDGQTSSGWETWTCVQNPGKIPVEIRVTYLPEGGGTPVSFTDIIRETRRQTYNMAEKGMTGRASVLVESLAGGPIVVERAMYANSRGAGTCAMGGTFGPE